MRLIDADAIEHCLVIGGRRHGKTIISEIIRRAIQTAPTVDAVQVIRCKDCKYWYAGENINYCRKFWDDDGEPKLYRCTADDFCSRAERKEE